VGDQFAACFADLAVRERLESASRPRRGLFALALALCTLALITTAGAAASLWFGFVGGAYCGLLWRAPLKGESA
jgi:hypothetical protein